MPLEHNCVVHIKSRLSTNDAHTLSTGSGYLVTPKHIITAAHVVYHKENCSNPNTDLDTLKIKIKIRFLTGQPTSKSYFATPAYYNKQADICILSLDSDLINPVTPNFKFGQLSRDTHQILSCRACGFPKASQETNSDGSIKRYISSGLRGTIDLDGDVNTGLFPIALTPGFSPSSSDLCKGFSGSAVFVQDFLVGIITLANSSYSGSRLTMFPISSLFQDSTFLNTLAINDSLPVPVSPIINNKPRIFIQCFSREVTEENINNLESELVKSNFYVHSTSPCKLNNWKDILLNNPGRCETGIIIFDKQSITSDELASFLFILRWRNWLAEDNCHFLLVSTDEITLEELKQYECWAKLDLALTDLTYVRKEENNFVSKVVPSLQPEKTLKKTIVEIKEIQLVNAIKKLVNDDNIANITNVFIKDIDQAIITLYQLLAQYLLKTGIKGINDLKDQIINFLGPPDDFDFYKKVFKLLVPNLIDVRLAGLIQKFIKKEQECIFYINVESFQIAKLFICQAYYGSYFEKTEEITKFSFIEITSYSGKTTEEIMRNIKDKLQEKIRTTKNGIPIFTVFPYSITSDSNLRNFLIALNKQVNNKLKQTKQNILVFVFLMNENSNYSEHHALQLTLDKDQKKAIIEDLESAKGICDELSLLVLKILSDLGCKDTLFDSEDPFDSENILQV